MLQHARHHYAYSVQCGHHHRQQLERLFYRPMAICFGTHTRTNGNADVRHTSGWANGWNSSRDRYRYRYRYWYRCRYRYRYRYRFITAFFKLEALFSQTRFGWSDFYSSVPAFLGQRDCKKNREAYDLVQRVRIRLPESDLITIVHHLNWFAGSFYHTRRRRPNHTSPIFNLSWCQKVLVTVPHRGGLISVTKVIFHRPKSHPCKKFLRWVPRRSSSVPYESHAVRNSRLLFSTADSRRKKETKWRLGDPPPKQSANLSDVKASRPKVSRTD